MKHILLLLLTSLLFIGCGNNDIKYVEMSLDCDGTHYVFTSGTASYSACYDRTSGELYANRYEINAGNPDLSINMGAYDSTLLEKTHFINSEVEMYLQEGVGEEYKLYKYLSGEFTVLKREKDGGLITGEFNAIFVNKKDENDIRHIENGKFKMTVSYSWINLPGTFK